MSYDLENPDNERDRLRIQLAELRAELDAARERVGELEAANAQRAEDQAVFFDLDGKERCIEESAIAEMLYADVLFSNSRRYVCTDGSVKDETIVLFVNCNDLFFWACADAESLPYSEVATLYRMWKDEPSGASRWCCRQRKMRPQAPIERDWRAAGTWTDELESYPARDPKECG